MNMMSYKGYLGSVEYSSEDHCLYGKVAYIRDLINYKADNVAVLESNFCCAVDDYLRTCTQLNKSPATPFKGSFNVRTEPELHRAAVLGSATSSLNQFVCEAIRENLERQGA